MKFKLTKQRRNGLISLLLVLSIAFSLLVPFDLTAIAVDEPAKPGEMHAI